MLTRFLVLSMILFTFSACDLDFDEQDSELFGNGLDSVALQACTDMHGEENSGHCVTCDSTQSDKCEFCYKSDENCGGCVSDAYKFSSSCVDCAVGHSKTPDGRCLPTVSWPKEGKKLPVQSNGAQFQCPKDSYCVCNMGAEGGSYCWLNCDAKGSFCECNMTQVPSIEGGGSAECEATKCGKNGGNCDCKFATDYGDHPPTCNINGELQIPAL